MEGKVLQNQVLTAQVVAEALEHLTSMGRIVIAAYDLDGYATTYMSELFGMSEDVIHMERGRAIAYISTECKKYEKQNNCILESIDGETIRAAFGLLLKQSRYTMAESVSLTLYNAIWCNICA